MEVSGHVSGVALGGRRLGLGGVPVTRFVYVLPAGRLRWEVRVDTAKIIEAGADALFPLFNNQGRDFEALARAVIEAAMPALTEPQFYRRKAHALIAARAIAIVIGGEVQPHNRWGRIQDPDSYGPDPERSAG